MTFQPVPIASAQFDQLADDVPGFTSDEQLLKNKLQTTIFVSGASSSSDGRASYILGNEGERVWLPNTLACWINDLKIVIQTYEQYDPVEKLLVYVTSINSTSWVYRMGLDTWASSSLLTNIKSMSLAMLNERVQISLKPKGRSCFVDVSSIMEDQSDYKRVQIKEADLGRKLGYTEMLDVISYFHLAQSSMEAQMAQASIEAKQLPASSESSSEAWLNPGDLGASPKHLQRLQPHEYIASHF
ncbi:hypothetical protein SynRS9915_00218 [Synechococcus sp. RS9915]|nr:hypothetical protein SynRS9915_00218 [Synechococcus sp. RS9915]